MKLCAMVLLGSALALGACSSEEDGEGSGGAGGETGNGGDGNVGNDGGNGTGGGGGIACHGCAVEVQCLQGEETGAVCDEALCDNSGDLFATFAECVCTECSVECAMACDGLEPEADCAACVMGASGAGAACAMAFDACSNDA